MASPTEVRNQWAQYFREQDLNELYRRQARVIIDMEPFGETLRVHNQSHIPIRAFILCPHCKGLILDPPRYGRFAPCSCGCWAIVSPEKYLFLQKQDRL